jgi:hypothetical protein
VQAVRLDASGASTDCGRSRGDRDDAFRAEDRQAARRSAFGARPWPLTLDRNQLMQAVMRAEPEVMIHQLTGLAGVKSLKNFDSEFALANAHCEGVLSPRCAPALPPCRGPSALMVWRSASLLKSFI